MPASVFGAPAAAVQLYMAFYGAAPSNPIYENLVAVAGASSPLNLALTIGNEFRTVSDTQLATTVLTNIGITASTIPAASYTALQTALTQAFAAYPTQRGIVVYNALNLLRGLEADATFGTVAQAFNQAVTNSYVYASNAQNTITQPVGAITTTSPLTVNFGDVVNGTTGNDNINGNLFYNQFTGGYVQTLNTGDVVNGGTGTDTLSLGLNGGGTVVATLTSIENLAVNDIRGGSATTLDMTNGTGLTSVSIANGANAADLTINSLGTALTNVALTATGAGLFVNNTAASIAGTADTIAVALTQVANTAGAAPTFVPLSLAGYETVNITSSGPSTNRVNVDGYSAGATFNVAGARSVALSSGVSTNQIIVDATGLTGTATLAVTASGGTGNNVRVTGGANGDTVTFGANYTAADTYNGAGGNDTISVGNASAANLVTGQGNLSNLEILSISDAVAAGVIAALAAPNLNPTFTPAVFGGASQLTLTTASAVAYQVNFGAGTSGLNLRANNAAATVSASGTATNDVLNLTVGVTDTTLAVTSGAITSTGFETINVTSNGALGAANTVGAITTTATAAPEIVNFSGSINLTVGAIQADQVNASGMTGSLVMTAAGTSAGLSAGVAVTTNGQQITGGSAADTLIGSDGADQIVGGGGADRIMFGTAASQGDIVTGGDGGDQFRFIAQTQSAGTAQIVKITDFVAGTDKIGLIGIGGITAIGAVSTATLATADTLTQVYAGAGATTAAGATTPAARVLTVAAGQAAGTYLIIDNNNNGSFTDTTDMMINITGVTGTVGTGDFAFS